MKSINLNQEGFSLVETLVAITILLVVVVGPMTISTSTARSTSFSSEQVVAFFLAQEGAEIVQMARDDLLLDYFDSGTDAWIDFTNETTGPLNECYTSNGCGLYLDTDSTGSFVITPATCGSGACLLYEAATGGDRARYTHDNGGELSSYTRKITIENINPNEVKVVSEVSWRTGNQRDEQNVTVETQLFNVYGI